MWFTIYPNPGEKPKKFHHFGKNLQKWWNSTSYNYVIIAEPRLTVGLLPATDYFRGANPRISLASAGVATSLPSNLASSTTFATIWPLDSARTPFSM